MWWCSLAVFPSRVSSQSTPARVKREHTSRELVKRPQQHVISPKYWTSVSSPGYNVMFSAHYSSGQAECESEDAAVALLVFRHTHVPISPPESRSTHLLRWLLAVITETPAHCCVRMCSVTHRLICSFSIDIQLNHPLFMTHCHCHVLEKRVPANTFQWDVPLEGSWLCRRWGSSLA